MTQRTPAESAEIAQSMAVLLREATPMLEHLEELNRKHGAADSAKRIGETIAEIRRTLLRWNRPPLMVNIELK